MEQRRLIGQQSCMLVQYCCRCCDLFHRLSVKRLDVAFGGIVMQESVCNDAATSSVRTTENEVGNAALAPAGELIGRIDAGIVEVSLALSALLALLAIEGKALAIRLVASLLLLVSSVGAEILYWCYVQSKMSPQTRSEMISRQGPFARLTLPWLVVYWGRRVLRWNVSGLTRVELADLGYLTVYVAFHLSLYFAGAWVVYSWLEFLLW